jgi:hypothetical protein
MNLVERAQNIILKPKEEWVKIKGESTPIAQLFMGYAAILAAIPAIAQFIGYGLIGFRAYRWPIGSALARAVIYYVLTLVAAYIFGIVINALAPSFASKPNMENAMKLAVFGMTPAWIGGIFYLLPSLASLAGLAGLYGLYIMYLGYSTPMMGTPKESVVGFLIVSIVIAAILYVVVMLVAGAFFVFPRFAGI